MSSQANAAAVRGSSGCHRLHLARPRLSLGRLWQLALVLHTQPRSLEHLSICWKQGIVQCDCHPRRCPHSERGMTIHAYSNPAKACRQEQQLSGSWHLCASIGCAPRFHDCKCAQQETVSHVIASRQVWPGPGNAPAMAMSLELRRHVVPSTSTGQGCRPGQAGTLCFRSHGGCNSLASKLGSLCASSCFRAEALVCCCRTECQLEK